MSSKKKILFIVNPKSGTQDKEEILSLIKDRIESEKYTIHIALTERPGHAVEIARQAIEDKIDFVIAIGGDGTVNEIARSLVHSETALDIIPYGSGNGLARHLHIPLKAAKAIDVINKGEISLIDYGKINCTPFFLCLWDRI